MLIVTLQGGLGNQMFQYALARKLEAMHGQPVFLDPTPLLTGADDGLARQYGLHRFDIRGSLLPAGEAARLQETTSVVCLIQERLPAYQPEILHPGPFPLVILNGFWQSERYFHDIAETLKSEFRLREPLPSDAPALPSIHGDDSVCLHVRRQDYLQQGGHLGFIGVEYYRRAIATLIARVPHAHFHVFSDDVCWCAEHLRIEYPHTFVDYDPGPAAAACTLHLMSRCSHFAIGNSTFSWWAAWLGRAPHKVVVAPAGWFASERDASAAQRYGSLTSKDLVPEAWIRV